MSSIQMILMAAVVLLFGCVVPSPAAAPEVRSLAKGAFSGIQEPTEQVITDKAEWEKVWAKHSVTKPSEKTPDVDFSKDMVIAVTMGRKTSGGYAIQVVSVQPVEGKLRIGVARKTPPPGAITVQALTAPFHFVAVPKSDLKPEFVEAPAPPRKEGSSGSRNKE